MNVNNEQINKSSQNLLDILWPLYKHSIPQRVAQV